MSYFPFLRFGAGEKRYPFCAACWLFIVGLVVRQCLTNRYNQFMVNRILELELEEAPYSEEDAEWDAFVAAHPHGSLLQTSQWARLKGRFGWTASRVWLRQDGRLVAGAQILYRARALGVVRMGYIPHGPLVDWENDEQVAVLFNQIDMAAYRNRAGILKIEPLLWQNAFSPSRWEALCRQHGCLPHTDTIQPPQTILIDLRPSPEEILERIKEKSRYNIRLAERKGVTVRQGSAEDLATFAHMMQITGQRNNFGIHVPRYYQDAFIRFAPDHVGLFIAEYQGQPLAGVMAFAYGRQGAYLYGASNDQERQRMPTYAAQWAAIQWARAQGCDYYDLWGIPDHPETELEDRFQTQHDGLWGVYRFKRGFGGDVYRTVGSADRAYNKTLYRLYEWYRRRETPPAATG